MHSRIEKVCMETSGESEGRAAKQNGCKWLETTQKLEEQHHNWTGIVPDSDAKEALTKICQDLYHFPDKQEAKTQKERRQ